MLFMDEYLVTPQTWHSFYKEHLKERNSSLAKLKLPYPTLRRGQLDLMRELAASISAKENFLLNAPTGFGKTLTTVVPALAALGKEICDKIFYCTAKESTRALPAALLTELNKVNKLKLWTVTLYAQERLCNYHEFCHRIFKKSFLQEVVQKLISETELFERHLQLDDFLFWGKELNVCPYLLMLQLAVYADFIILDYNYLCDPLQQLSFFKGETPYVLLCDEAHNLVSRGQNIFSTDINIHILRELKKFLANETWLSNPSAKQLQQAVNSLLTPLERLGRLMLKLPKVKDSEQQKETIRSFFANKRFWTVENSAATTPTDTAVVRAAVADAVQADKESAVAASQFSATSSKHLAAADASAISVTTDKETKAATENLYALINKTKLLNEEIFYAETAQYAELFIKVRLAYLPLLCRNIKKAWSTFYHDYAHKLSLSTLQLKQLTYFVHKLERFSYLLETCWQNGSILQFKIRNNKAKQNTKVASFDFVAEIHNLDCSSLLRKTFPKNSSIIFFSATLLPLDYFRQMLTTSDSKVKMKSATLDYLNENRNVAVLNYLNLEYRKRAYNIQDVAQILAAYMQIRGGHLLAFVPSYAYAEQLKPYLQQLLPKDCRLLSQQRYQAKLQDQVLIKILQEEQEQKILLLAVLQGAFSEGLDLPGKAITGIAVVSVAFPTQSNLLELSRHYYEESRNVYHDQRQVGYLYTDLYPSFTKILQACGRLIRSETDSGDILLIDSRFEREEYKSLLKSAFDTYTGIDSPENFHKWLNNLPPLNFEA